MTPPFLQASDLRGVARLTTDAVAGLASLVEAMHARIASAPRLPFVGDAQPPRERTSGITGLVYRTVGGVTRLVGGSAEALFGLLEPLLAHATPSQASRPEREAVLCALNGVVGDHLAATANPLAITMKFCHAGLPLLMNQEALRVALPHAGPKLLVLIHGLCMNHLQWHRDEHDHGLALARDGGYTPIYLHYNSGLSIAANGRMLAAQMQRLVDTWPVPIERLVLLGHSMGGLVARSALHQAGLDTREGLRWPALVGDLVCLGSPHHGAPLERAGHGIDLLLGAAPYAAPLARLGKVRSAGITDLRRGRIVGDPAGAAQQRGVSPVTLPAGVRCYAVAASLGRSRGHLKARLWGDGLVPVDSALGHHRDPGRRLAFDAQRQVVVDETGHLDLLSSAEVYAHLKRWLA